MLAIDLTGKTALVIGGSRGIGGAISLSLAESGAKTGFTHTGNPKYKKAVHDLLEKMRKSSGWAKDYAVSASDAEGTEKVIGDFAAEAGRIDILVFNAGVCIPRPVEDTPVDEWQKVIDLNLSGAFYAVRAAMPFMLGQGRGRIIFIGSSAAYDGGGGSISYAASKVGIAGMNAYLARNYSKKGITSNVVHPCVIDTDMLRIRYNTEELRKKLARGIPVGRLGKPEDISNFVAYLASDMADYITGQQFLIDGGRTLYG